LQSIESALDTPHKMCKITHAMSSPEPTPHAPITPATHIKDLVEDPDNRRAHTPRNIGMIADSLQAVGVGRSIVIDEKNQLIGGHGVVEAAAQVGITKVKVVEADGNEIVAVQRRNLTPEQKRAMALYDNRTAELSEWSIDQLKDDVASGLDLSPFFTEDELEKLLGTDEAATKPEKMTVPRPVEVVWVLLAIPLESWPQHQMAVEQMQGKARFSTTVIRSKDSDGLHHPTA
jgi:hypothetical protein